MALIVVAGVAAFVINQTSSGGDIFLEGAGDTGANPFTTIAVRPCADGLRGRRHRGLRPRHHHLDLRRTSSIPNTTTTALYGGSGSQKKCDPEALIAYLTSHADKAKAWVQGLNEDPSLSWSGGNKVTVADIPAFIRELTPTFLDQDTRVTNHGYFNGKATPHQSVLQKGTAVLVDRTGVPRSRCVCGNPLGLPHKVNNPHYKGNCWADCHSQPYCAPPGCTGTTSTTEPTTTTTLRAGPDHRVDRSSHSRSVGRPRRRVRRTPRPPTSTLVVRTTLGRTAPPTPCPTTSSVPPTTTRPDDHAEARPDDHDDDPADHDHDDHDHHDDDAATPPPRRCRPRRPRLPADHQLPVDHVPITRRVRRRS